jgi:superfamily II DNA or RNA helicase
MSNVSVHLTGKNKIGLLDGDKDSISLIREHFSVSNPAYNRARFAPSRIYSITPQGKFEIGLYGEIIKFCVDNNISLSSNQEFTKLYNPGVKDPSVLSLNKTYRDYQEKSIYSAIRHGRGVIVIPTAGGKTLIMAGLISSLIASNNFKKILVIVPSIQLVEQTADDFSSYGLKGVSKWSGNNPYNPDSIITVAGSQILLSKKTDLSVLADVDLLLVDEVHSVKRGNEINNILKFIETPHRFGFTGTLPSTKIDEWNIIGKFGPIVYEEKTHSLKVRSFVSNFRIVIIHINHKDIPRFEVDNALPALVYQQESEFLQNSFRRNEVITNLSLRLQENSLIMVDRIEHGRLVFNMIKQMMLLREMERPVYFIQGATEMEDREKIRSLMDERRDVIVVAISKIFSTGINIPNLHNIIFASAGKAKIKIMQSIGRVLRLHHTKSMATVFDIADNTKYGLKHVEERKKMYKLEKYEYTEKEV